MLYDHQIFKPAIIAGELKGDKNEPQKMKQQLDVTILIQFDFAKTFAVKCMIESRVSAQRDW